MQMQMKKEHDVKKPTVADSESIKAWMAVGLTLGPRSHWLKPLFRAFGSPAAILSAAPAALSEICPGMGQGTLSTLTGGAAKKEAERLFRWCCENGITVLTPGDARYPGRVWDIAEPPAALYCKGRLPLPLDRPSVGIVGTRDIDAYGERVTYKLSFELAAAGAMVVSGMADGADGVAAAAALDAGGHTVAVLGCGIDLAYPKHHGRLMREICEYGTVITEYAPGSPPNGWHFPMRNRLISALSEAVLVTEADEDSGALITARYALLQGKALFAVPGDIDRFRSEGTNALIRSGASPVSNVEDILTHFRFVYRDAFPIDLPPEAMQYTDVTEQKLRAHGLRSVEAKEAAKAPKTENADGVLGLFRKKRRQPTSRVETPPTPKKAVTPYAGMLNPQEKQIYDTLPAEPFSVDHVTALGIPAGTAAATLTIFELYGLVASRPGGFYQKL